MTFKATLRKFETMDQRRIEFPRKRSRSRETKNVAIEGNGDSAGLDSRQSDQHDHRALSFHHIDRRLPSGNMRASPGRTKHLSM